MAKLSVTGIDAMGTDGTDPRQMRINLQIALDGITHRLSIPFDTPRTIEAIRTAILAEASKQEQTLPGMPTDV